MPDLVLIGAVVAVAALLGLYLRAPRPQPVVFADPREEKLAVAVARQVGCSPADALPAVRREIDIAPDKPDETLVKRAVYHYRMNAPEKTCSAWRDRAPG